MVESENAKIKCELDATKRGFALNQHKHHKKHHHRSSGDDDEDKNDTAPAGQGEEGDQEHITPLPACDGKNGKPPTECRKAKALPPCKGNK